MSEVRGSLWNAVRAPVGDAILDTVNLSLWEGIGDVVMGKVMDKVLDAVGEKIVHEVGETVCIAIKGDLE